MNFRRHGEDQFNVGGNLTCSIDANVSAESATEERCPVRLSTTQFLIPANRFLFCNPVQLFC